MTLTVVNKSFIHSFILHSLTGKKEGGGGSPLQRSYLGFFWSFWIDILSLAVNSRVIGTSVRYLNIRKGKDKGIQVYNEMEQADIKFFCNTVVILIPRTLNRLYYYYKLSRAFLNVFKFPFII